MAGCGSADGLGILMADVLPLAGDVAAAGATLAGLMLVFLGHTHATYDRHSTTEKQAVLRAYQHRARWAFVGFAFSLAASFLSLFGKWQNVAWRCMAASLSVSLS